MSIATLCTCITAHDRAVCQGWCKNEIPSTVLARAAERIRARASETKAARAAPMLACPECGEDVIATHDRGRHDKGGNYIGHGLDCRCRWCEWIWFDDATPVLCACGARVSVSIDGSGGEPCAYAQVCK